MVSVACLTIGSRVTYDGGVCTVVALAGDRVTVQEQCSGRTLSVRIASLLAAPGSRADRCRRRGAGRRGRSARWPA